MNFDGIPFALARMELDDVPTVSTIEQIVFTLPWSSNAFRYELRNNPSSEYLVLRYLPWANKARGGHLWPATVLRFFRPSPENDLSLLGYGGFWMMLEEAHICTLALRPEWRGRGLGELLLLSLIGGALDRRAEVITLEARVTNTVAQNLYTKYGFKIVGRRKGYYSDNGEDAYIMTTDSVVTAEYQERLRELEAHLRERLLAQPDQPPVAEPSQESS